VIGTKLLEPYEVHHVLNAIVRIGNDGFYSSTQSTLDDVPLFANNKTKLLHWD
jgi:hypothetical protein